MWREYIRLINFVFWKHESQMEENVLKLELL